MIVVADIQAQKDRKAIHQFALSKKLPVYLDVLSGMRGMSGLKVQKAIPENLPIERVIQFGGRLSDPKIQKWIKKNAQEHWHVSPDHRRLDPEYSVTKKIVSGISQWCDSDHPQPRSRPGPGHGGERKIPELELSEPLIATILAQALDDTWALFLSNSMPIRVMDQFAYNLRCSDVGANRGVSGIDGIISSAVGYSLGCRKSTVLLIGDLAFFHDANGMKFLENHPYPLVIILINNGGGGIFSHLPVAKTDIHERYFYTPHDYDLSGYTKVFGLPHHRRDTVGGFKNCLDAALDKPRHQVIEAVIDQATNLKIYRQLKEAQNDLDNGKKI